MTFAFATGPPAGASWVRERAAPDVAPTFVPRALLEYDLPPGTPSELAQVVENELLRLGACEARLELDLGKVLGSITLGVAKSLGHSSLAGFASQVLGFSWSHARELTAISKALTSLPLLRAAFLGGALPRCKVREVIRVASVETEAAWLVLASKLGTRGLTRAVATELAARKSAGSPTKTDPSCDPPELQPMTRVRVRASAADALFFEHVGRPMLRAVVGVQGPDHVLVEALAADALSELGPPDGDEPEGCVQGRARRRRARHVVPTEDRCRSRERDDVAARRLLHRFACRLGGIPAVAWPDVRVLPDSPAALLRLCERLIRWRHGLAWQRGRLLDLVLGRGWHRVLGARNFTEWHEGRLGLSPQEAQSLLRRAREVEFLPEIADAWRRGDLGVQHVRLTAGLATRETARDWVSFAGRATLKRLEVEVAAHRALRAGLGERRWREITRGLPMEDMTLVDLRSRWDGVIERMLRAQHAAAAAASTGRKGVRASGREPFDLRGRPDERRELGEQLLEGPLLSRARVTLGFDAPLPVAGLVREALRQTAREVGWILDEGGCLRRMCERFAATHVTEGLSDLSLRARILRRDGWECAMPHCRSRRHLDVHHVVFRSRGGSDDAANLLTLCSGCHRLLHDGGLHAEISASGDLVVRVGRDRPDCAPAWYRNGIRIRGSDHPWAA